MSDADRLEAALIDAVTALRHARQWIVATCDNARLEGTSGDTLHTGKAAALRPIDKALRRLRPYVA